MATSVVRTGFDLQDQINDLTTKEAYYRIGDYCNLPQYLLGYATSATTIRAYFPTEKAFIASGVECTVDFSLGANIYRYDATSISTTGTTVKVERNAAYNHYIEVGGLSGLTSNMLYRINIGGNRRIGFKAAT